MGKFVLKQLTFLNAFHTLLIQLQLTLLQNEHLLIIIRATHKAREMQWLMVSLLDSPWSGILCCVLGKDEFYVGGNPAMDSRPIQGGVKLLLVT